MWDLKLMFEVSDSGKYHCHIIGIAIINTGLVFHTSPGLYYRRNTRFIGNFYAIGEWEKGVASHNRATQVKPEFIGFLYGLIQGIHATRLSGTAGQ